MISVLLGHLFVVDDKHVRVHGGYVPVGLTENLKCPVNDLISGNDVLVVSGHIVQIDPFFGFAPCQGS